MEDRFRTWKPVRIVSVIDPYPSAAVVPAGLVVQLIAPGEVEIIVSHPSISDLGELPNVANWSGRLVGKGGPSGSEMWADVDNGLFDNRANRSFTKRINVSEFEAFAFQITELTKTNPALPIELYITIKYP